MHQFLHTFTPQRGVCASIRGCVSIGTYTVHVVTVLCKMESALEEVCLNLSVPENNSLHEMTRLTKVFPHGERCGWGGGDKLFACGEKN